jgi:hypothetical protein
VGTVAAVERIVVELDAVAQQHVHICASVVVVNLIFTLAPAG